MHICYVDEAGCPGALPSRTSDVQPVLVISGLFLPEEQIRPLTSQFIGVKRTFYPGMHRGSRHTLDGILPEVKGSDLRKQICEGNRDQRRHAFGFLDKILTILEDHGARLISRIWIKGIGKPFNGKSVYTFSIQNIYTHFQHYLAGQNSSGVLIADSRNQGLNVNVSHSVFTKKHSINGDQWPRTIEVPVFGHSDNHAGIQLTDLLSSAILTPMAVDTYCSGHISSVHIRPDYSNIKIRYSQRIKNLQYRYIDNIRGNKHVGGLTVDDKVSNKPGHLLFA